MKIVLVVSGVVIVFFSIVFVLFIRWANSPEQVAETQKFYKEQAAKKIEDEKKKIELDKEFAEKRAKLKLVIDENFAENRFESLDFTYQNFSMFEFKDHQFSCSRIIYKKNPPRRFFIFSKDDFEDFAAEIDLGIWGGDGFTGIFWDAQPNGQNDPTAYQAAYSSPNTLFVKTEDIDDYSLGGLIESENLQKLRVERFGKKLRVSVNGRILFDETVETSGKGKLGITLGDRGVPRDNNETMSVDIKSFKVWK